MIENEAWAILISSRGDPSVQAYGLPGNLRRLRAREKHDQIGHVPRIDDAEMRKSNRLAEKLAGEFIAHHFVMGCRALNDGGRHDVHPYAVSLGFDRQCPGEHDDAGHGGGNDGLAGRRHLRRIRRNVDDRAAALRRHPGKNDPAREQWSHDLLKEDGLDLVEPGLMQKLRRVGARRRIDEDIYAAKFLVRDLADGGRPVGTIAVACEKANLGTRGLRLEHPQGGLAALAIPADDANRLGSGLREADRGRQPDARRSARDQHPALFERPRLPHLCLAFAHGIRPPPERCFSRQ